jgi:adenosylmethionine-8-amino-7-oxononanoate aminotransferase
LNKLSPQLFVTGTDTDVGKTVISAALATYFAGLGKSRYWKPVQTGSANGDAATLQSLNLEFLEIVSSPWSYELPASPDQAAANEGRPAPKVFDLINFLDTLKQAKVPLIVEGAGGLEVPLNENNETWLDFLDQAGLPVVLVARTGLGTLNHTSLSIKALLNRGIRIIAVILNGPSHEANLASLKRVHPDISFIPFPELENWRINSSWQTESQNLGQSLSPLCHDRDSPGLTEKDHNYVWHPYTQHQSASPPLVVKRAKGLWLETEQHGKVADAIGSWWVNTIGHGRNEIGDAIRKQQATLDHCIFAGATHRPALELAEQLALRCPDYLTKVFYSDNGSCAVEIAMKMAIQGWYNQGIHNRHKILCLNGAYHGDTIGAMSVGGVSGFVKPFAPFLFESLKIDPVTFHRSQMTPRGSLALGEELENLGNIMKRHHEELAAIIVEPMIQGASGMNMQDVKWLDYLGSLAKTYGIPLIFDEVFTGMGRTGKFLALEHTTATPDIICLAKGLTGGNLPLAVTITSNEIYDKFLGDKPKAFFHGHSFTANPIACAAALATFAIYDQEKIIQHVGSIARLFNDWLEEKTAHWKLENPRSLGAVMAFELPSSGTGDYFKAEGTKFAELCLSHQLLIRPLGNTIYLTPPLNTTLPEIDFMLAMLDKALGANFGYS